MSLRSARWEYLNDVIGPSLREKPKAFYQYVKRLRQDSTGIQQLLSEGCLKSCSQEKADILSRQFESVFTTEPDNVLLPNILPSRYSSMEDISVHVNGVEKLLRGLDASKATGPDNIPAILLKETASEAIYLGIVIYAPALALNQVSGLHLWGSVLAIGIVCTFYTTIGGMKAVLWTDTFQVTVMMAGFLAVIIAGSMNLNGFSEAWRIAGEGGRLDIWDFNPDPTVRHTFWTVVVGGTFFWGTLYAVNQSQVQRYLTCGSEKTALLSLFIAIVGMIIVVTAACISGIVMYANFADCDPLTMGYVSKSDQLMPYFVMYLFGKMPGLPGLFTSAVFSAALSTVSSGVNSLAAVVGEDIVKSIWPKMNERTYTWITKGLALFFGLLSIAMAFVSSQLGSVLGAAFSVFGMIGGPLLGLYTSGMLFPWINSAGAFVGTLFGLTWSLWIGIGAQIYPPSSVKPPLSIDGCNVTMETMTTAMFDNLMNSSTMEPPVERPAIASLYSLSYAWYSCAAMLMTIFWAFVFSFITGANDPRNVNPMVISPIADRMYCCLPESVKRPLRCHVGELYEEEPNYQMDKFAGEEMKVAYSNPGYIGQNSPTCIGCAPSLFHDEHQTDTSSKI
ncbi:sodium-coupled monocarboxylate transporter 1-like [Lytechinus pictus]|uniref:sodium-coupled monocarboxylate transporter 1-like n=1 Tax=Lytechinus pictus TaxID=7653 RepID=UPI0030BA284B